MVWRPHVVLAIETSTIYGRRILSGIAQYLRSAHPWSIFIENCGLDESLPRWLGRWRGDGVIFRLISRQAIRRLQRMHIPMVNLNDYWPPLGLPLIRSDDNVIGRLAAEHLLERGFRLLAFCGFDNVSWSRRRRESFVAALGNRGIFQGEYQSPRPSSSSQSWEREQSKIGRWLQTLPKPLGVMACNDERGRHVLDACQEVNLAVPEEVAVIGVDDDALLCELSNPPLSSIVPHPQHIGYEAAALLDRLMAGERPQQQEWLVPPLEVKTRQSTEVLAIEDTDIAAALRFIREQACTGITVRDVLNQVPLSRTMLERRFRKYLGHSPQTEIRAVQIKQVKQLLAETDLPLDRIAGLTGYEHPEYLSAVFKRLTGQTPGRYRRLLKG